LRGALHRFVPVLSTQVAHCLPNHKLFLLYCINATQRLVIPQGKSLYLPKSESGELNTRIYDPVIKEVVNPRTTVSFTVSYHKFPVYKQK